MLEAKISTSKSKRMIVSYERCEVSQRDHQSLLTVLSVCHMSGTILCVTSSSCVILTQLCDGDDGDM